MCGIAGVMSPDRPSEQKLQRMSEALAHRGPDGRGEWHDEFVTLLHRRLSIIDVAHGQQPMVSADGKLVVTFNGEIYNYPDLRAGLEASGCVFRTNCDTEVLLHMYARWGSDFVSDLRGMFAFALYDRAEGQLLLVRDHLGQKPLFYTQTGSTLAFASEVKALLAGGLVSPEVDIETLWHHAGLRFCPDDMTLFRGVKKLRPGHLLIARPGERDVEIKRYWRLEYSRKTSSSYGEAADRLGELLDETVGVHLMSDVPVGSFLSGGVDSSLVSTLAIRHVDSDFPTFSIAVEDSDFSELKYARQAADIIGSRHHESRVEPDLMLLLPDIIWHLEQPADPHAVGLYLLSELAHPHVKVALGGDGGDETFGGYVRFTQSRLIDAYALLPRALRTRLVAPLLARLPYSFGYHNLADKAQWAHEISLRSGAARHYFAMTYFGFSEAQKLELFTADAAGRVSDSDTSRWITCHYEAVDSDDPLDRMLYIEQMTRMPEYFLHIADRMSMAHGLEMRAPLVDRQVVEFAATLPADFKIRPGELKVLLREIARRHFPADLIDRPKMGFKFPMARWFKAGLAQFVTGIFADALIFEAGLFDRAYVDRIVEEHQAGRVDHNFKIWNLLNLEIWYRLFISGHSREEVRTWLSGMIDPTNP
ncbi:MAG: asparagine synthase (glutamine-hydrolyzing) [Gemmatimonadota bacterium]